MALVVSVVFTVLCLAIAALCLLSDEDPWYGGIIFLALGTICASFVVGASVSGFGTNKSRMYLCLTLGAAAAAAMTLGVGLRLGDGDMLFFGGGFGVVAVGLGAEIVRDPDEERPPPPPADVPDWIVRSAGRSLPSVSE